MQKNLYFRTVFKRENVFLKVLFNTFLSLCSWPRLLLEVFLRKNFGERYFTLVSAITVAVILIFIPLGADQLFSMFNPYGRHGGQESNFWTKYATWYVFLAAFLYFSFMRSEEIKRNPSVYDFGRFSLCAGDINPVFYKLNFWGKATSRKIEIFYEPALFFIAGIILMFIGQKLGLLLIISSIFYSLSYAGAYKNGDNFVLDKIDEMIISEETEKAFVYDEEINNTRGVKFRIRKPNGEDLRRRVAETFIEEDDNDEIADVK